VTLDIDFELFLTLATLLTGIICLIDVMFFAKHRQPEAAMPKVFEYSHSFFPVLLIVLLLRSFVVEPFRIPSGSLEPTLVPGDFIAANKFAYGLRLPISHTKILAISEPKAGEIAVFRYPVDQNMDLIKRVVGVPGDKVSYVNKVLYINGVEQPQEYLGPGLDAEDGYDIPVNVYQETLNGVKHLIYVNPTKPANDITVTVPSGEYFMMGDNRDNSNDSRYWGFMPEGNLVGKAFFIWFSWDGDANSVRWNRIGERINHP
jgi:signal peptidase I